MRAITFGWTSFQLKLSDLTSSAGIVLEDGAIREPLGLLGEDGPPSYQWWRRNPSTSGDEDPRDDDPGDVRYSDTTPRIDASGTFGPSSQTRIFVSRVDEESKKPTAPESDMFTEVHVSIEPARFGESDAAAALESSRLWFSAESNEPGWWSRPASVRADLYLPPDTFEVLLGLIGSVRQALWLSCNLKCWNARDHYGPEKNIYLDPSKDSPIELQELTVTDQYSEP